MAHALADRVLEPPTATGGPATPADDPTTDPTHPTHQEDTP